MFGRSKLAYELADRIFAVGNRSQAANLAVRFGYATAIVSAWTSKPKNRNFSLRKPGDPGLLFGTIRFRAIDARLVAERTPASCDF